MTAEKRWRCRWDLWWVGVRDMSNTDAVEWNWLTKSLLGSKVGWIEDVLFPLCACVERVRRLWRLVTLPQYSVHVDGSSSSPCRFQRWPRMDILVTAFLEIREEVGVISTWMERMPSLLDFRAAPWSDDLMAFPTFWTEKHFYGNVIYNHNKQCNVLEYTEPIWINSNKGSFNLIRKKK